MNLRKLAKGQECQVRYPGVCNFNRETTVLAHYRLSGLCGTGLKPPDLLGSWTCSSCHDLIDGRTSIVGMMTRDSIRLAHAEGVLRTIDQLSRQGKL